jgi:hypothetical protein
MGADKNSSRRRRRLQQDEHGFQHTSPTQLPKLVKTSATDPRNQQTTFQAKTHQHTHRKLARLAALSHRSDRWPAPVRPVDRAGQTGGYSSRTTNVLESLSDFSWPWNKNIPKTQLARKENPTQNLTKQLQTDQELTSNNTTQRHMD